MAVVACLLGATWSNAATVVGQLLGPGARIDGVPAPGGTTLVSPSLLETRGRAVDIRLANGVSVKMEPNSTAVVQSSAADGIWFSVKGGTALVRDSLGDRQALPERGSLRLDSSGAVEVGYTPDAALVMTTVESKSENWNGSGKRHKGRSWSEHSDDSDDDDSDCNASPDSPDSDSDSGDSDSDSDDDCDKDSDKDSDRR